MYDYSSESEVDERKKRVNSNSFKKHILNIDVFAFK